MADDNSDASDEKREDSVPEKATFWASLLVVLALFVFLGFHGCRAESPGSTGAHPAVMASVEGKKIQLGEKNQWIVPVTVHNVGNLALEEVQVRVSFTDKHGKSQDVDLTFAYLAEGATENGFVVMDAPPTEAKPEATVSAFKTQRRARGY